MREDLLEHVAHLQVVRVALVVVDVAAGERRLVQVPDEHLLIERQRVEAVRVQLHHRRLVHALEQVLAVSRWRTRFRGWPLWRGHSLSDDRRVPASASSHARACRQCQRHHNSSQRADRVNVHVSIVWPTES